MSIHDIEITKLNGDYMAYVRIQNDWTGQIRGRIATVVNAKGRKHIIADGQKKDVTTLVEDYIRKEDQIKEALKWYKQTKW